jgi:hypothetical protein
MIIGDGFFTVLIFYIYSSKLRPFVEIILPMAKPVNWGAKSQRRNFRDSKQIAFLFLFRCKLREVRRAANSYFTFNRILFVRETNFILKTCYFSEQQ